MPELLEQVTTPSINSAGPAVATLSGSALAARLPKLIERVARESRLPLSRHPGWLNVLANGLDHTPYCLETRQDDQCTGILPLAAVKSLLFGHFLVGLPYLNYGGPITGGCALRTRAKGRPGWPIGSIKH